MNKQIKIVTSTLILLLSLLVCNHTKAAGPGPPPPPPHGTINDIQAGGTAPIGDGLWIFAVLGVAYGIRYYLVRRKEAQLED